FELLVIKDITMKKFQKLLIITTVIVSIFGCNIHTSKAQNSPKLIAAYSSTKGDSDVGIKQDFISFFYDSGDFLEKCSSFINSGYTRPRTRITNIEGIWKRTGDLIYVRVRSSAGLSGERKYQITPEGLLNLDTGTRLTKQ
ncbi:MAG: hypothetical protein ACK45Z_21575, partial [Dolichospermum sp.]